MSTAEISTTKTWNILIVDDDEDVHRVTDLALKRRAWRKIGFTTHHAYSCKQGKEFLNTFSNVQVAIVDVVMETEHAGLELCQFIRATFPASLRIVLRTGQPGVAPEDWVLENYDIDTYLPKVEATADRLYVAIRQCLRTSGEISALEEANASLSVSNATLKRQARFRELVLDEFGGEDRSALDKLTEQLAKAEGAAPDDVRELGALLSQMGGRIAKLLQPKDFQAQLEDALKNHSVLILQQNGKAMRLTQSALAGIDATTAIAETREDGVEALRTGRIDLLFVDWQNLSILEEAVEYNPEILAVLMTTQSVFEQFGETIMQLPISSAVVINTLFGSDTPPDALLIQELVVTAGKLLSRDIFGLEKYLSWGVRVHEFVCRHTNERFEALEQLEAFAKECQLRGSIRRKLQILCDELLMNAMWDAPVDAAGQPKYADLGRRGGIPLDPSEAVLLRFASDGNLLAVSVADSFGRLQREIAFKYLLKCFARDGAQISYDSGGAGLGLSMAYLAMSNLVINCSPGRKTEVIGVLNLRLSPREMSGRPRSFHYFCTR